MLKRTFPASSEIKAMGEAKARVSSFEALLADTAYSQAQQKLGSVAANFLVRKDAKDSQFYLAEQKLAVVLVSVGPSSNKVMACVVQNGKFVKQKTGILSQSLLTVPVTVPSHKQALLYSMADGKGEDTPEKRTLRALITKQALEQVGIVMPTTPVPLDFVGSKAVLTEIAKNKMTACFVQAAELVKEKKAVQSVEFEVSTKDRAVLATEGMTAEKSAVIESLKSTAGIKAKRLLSKAAGEFFTKLQVSIKELTENQQRLFAEVKGAADLFPTMNASDQKGRSKEIVQFLYANKENFGGKKFPELLETRIRLLEEHLVFLEQSYAIEAINEQGKVYKIKEMIQMAFPDTAANRKISPKYALSMQAEMREELRVAQQWLALCKSKEVNPAVTEMLADLNAGNKFNETLFPAFQQATHQLQGGLKFLLAKTFDPKIGREVSDLEKLQVEIANATTLDDVLRLEAILKSLSGAFNGVCINYTSALDNSTTLLEQWAGVLNVFKKDHLDANDKEVIALSLHVKGQAVADDKANTPKVRMLASEYIKVKTDFEGLQSGIVLLKKAIAEKKVSVAAIVAEVKEAKLEFKEVPQAEPQEAPLELHEPLSGSATRGASVSSSERLSISSTASTDEADEQDEEDEEDDLADLPLLDTVSLPKKTLDSKDVDQNIDKIFDWMPDLTQQLWDFATDVYRSVETLAELGGKAAVVEQLCGWVEQEVHHIKAVLGVMQPSHAERMVSLLTQQVGSLERSKEVAPEAGDRLDSCLDAIKSLTDRVAAIANPASRATMGASMQREFVPTEEAMHYPTHASATGESAAPAPLLQAVEAHLLVR
ncbi:hypothetical protein BH10PSE19_BH10PSE19_17950 [soil metagenome]